MNTLIRFVIVTLTLLQLQSTQAQFECEEKNYGSKCPTVECTFDKNFKMKATWKCRCKVAIINSLVEDHFDLTSGLFNLVCSQSESNLEELWINDAQLEIIDNNIFGKYPNLKVLNLEGNRLRLNFSRTVDKITVLNISRNELNSIRRDSFVNFKSLKSINLCHNRLNRANYCFEKLTNLEEIYLSNNHLLSVEPNEFNHLKNLTILDLSHNLLESIDTNFCLVHLIELHLNDNKLSSINPTELNCQNNTQQALKFVNMSNNELQSINANTFDINTRIETLDLSSNNITHIDPNNFQNFKNVTFLNLNNNYLTEKVISCDNLEHLENVNILQLSHNKISHIYDCTFSKLKNLSKLTLLANQLEKIPPSAFTALTKLQELNMAENKIEKIPDGLFDNLKEMEKLDISHNRLKSFDISSLKSNTKITDLNIRQNELEALDLRQLKNTLPSLRVLDFDSYLIRCEENIYADVLEFFEENNVVLKSCKSPKKCCDKLATLKVGISIIAVGTILTVLAFVGFIFIICRCMVPPGRNGGIQMMPIIHTSK